MSCRRSLLSYFVFMGLFLAGCAMSTPKGQPLPGMTFDHLDPISINVASVQVDQPPVPAGTPPNEAFIVPPDEAVHQYLAARFIPKGTHDKLQVNIEEASVRYAELPSKNQFGQWLGVAKTDEYNVTVKLDVMLIDDLNYRKAGKVISGSRRIRISEHVSLAEREKAQYEALESLITDLDDALTRAVTQEFGL